MKSIWIIDDDEEMTRAVQLMLKLLNYTSAGFLGARTAAQSLLAGQRPDLILLDINMPEVSGLDFLEFLRRRPEGKGMPVVMLTSEASDAMMDQAAELGADSYVSKPVTIEELERAMNEAFVKRLVEKADKE
jgi:two-component system chemotaxis response regulator CheY